MRNNYTGTVLFRGKQLGSGGWIFGQPLFFDARVKIYIPNSMKIVNGVGSLFSEEVDPETVSQWTGLTDEEGINIFGGDICKTSDERIVVVEWIDEMSKFEISQYLKRDGKTVLYDSWCLHSQELGIIGNVWDNPELLER